MIHRSPTVQFHRSFIYSTVVMWRRHRGSYEDHTPLFGEYLPKELVHRGAVGHVGRRKDQPFLQPRTPLWPTGVPHGVEESPRSIRSSRQTRPVQQRRGHEDQTPVVPKGFGTPPAVVVAAQRPLAVLITRVRWPPLPRQADAVGGVPVHPVRDQHDTASCQRLSRNTDHDPDLAQGGNADPQRDTPVGGLADGEGAIGRGRDQRPENPRPRGGDPTTSASSRWHPAAAHGPFPARGSLSAG